MLASILKLTDKYKWEEMYMGVIIGFVAGMITMLLLKLNSDNYYEKRAKELEDEIAMMNWLEVKNK